MGVLLITLLSNDIIKGKLKKSYKVKPTRNFMLFVQWY